MMQQISLVDDFSMLRVRQLGTEVPQAGGQLVLQIPQGRYNLKRSNILLQFSANVAATQRVMGRKDCLPSATQCQVQHDGVIIAQFQTLGVSQYQWFYRKTSQYRGQGYFYQNAGAHNVDTAKKSVIPLGLGTGAAATYTVSYPFHHFFAGLFDGIDILEVKQQLSVTLNLAPDSRTAFAIAIDPNSSNGPASAVPIAAITLSTIFGNMCAPQQAQPDVMTHKNFIMQYSGNSANSLTYSYVPQQNSLLHTIGLAFIPAAPTCLNFGEDTQLIDAATQLITINGFQILSSSAAHPGQFTALIQSLREDAVQDSDATECLIPVKIANTQVQINVSLGTASTQVITFYETMSI